MSAVMDPIVAAADEEGFDPFAGGAIERIAPTTEAQREVWLGDRLSTEASLAFNESIVLRLRGRARQPRHDPGARCAGWPARIAARDHLARRHADDDR